MIGQRGFIAVMGFSLDVLDVALGERVCNW